MARKNRYDELEIDETYKEDTSVENEAPEEEEYDYENEESTEDDILRMKKVLKGYRIIIIALVAVMGLLTFQHFRLVEEQKENFRM